MMVKQYTYPSPIIAERIQQVFWDNNIVDRQVAEVLNVDRKTPMKYRLGYSNPSIKFIRWICSTYKVDVRWLLDLD